MRVIICENMHHYDGDTYTACPICGSIRIFTGKAEEKMTEKPHHGFQWPWGPGKSSHTGKTPISASEPKSIPEPVPAPQPVPAVEPAPAPAPDPHTHTGTPRSTTGVFKPVRDEKTKTDDTEPANEPSKEPQSSSLTSAVNSAAGNRAGVTMGYFDSVTNKDSNTLQINPVVGWLVCVDGPHLGASFDLHAGRNSIGRESSNMIVLSNDPQVSRQNHAAVIYEPRKREFYLQPGNSSSLTYCQKELAVALTALESGFIIELGGSQLLFLGLCGPDFSWEDKMGKKAE